MKKQKVTTHDISKLLGISRNTVSKALNDHASVSEHTKQKVREAAASLGYKSVDATAAEETEAASTTARGGIAFITNIFTPANNGFWMGVIKGIEEITAKNNYELLFDFIKPDELAKLSLPSCVVNRSVNGLIVSGYLSKEYTDLLASVDLPKVFLDARPDLSFSALYADILLVENEDSVYDMTTHLIGRGHRHLGFVGDIASCRSFMERWLGFKRAVLDAGLTLEPDYCATGPNPSQYHHYDDIENAFKRLEAFPTAFVCANDTIAIRVIQYLRNKGFQVPEQIAVTGFDHSEHADFVTPALTTVHYDEKDWGRRAAEELLWRMNNPARPYELVRLGTKVIYNDSTSTVPASLPVVAAPSASL
ncbi:LacI family DNA-binding transcriptional regulator [Paenibacillus elgii]|uniref:LacI family DNA-binding transcriptional regulator n=1 Tax=Paenibacillus elgii TaxID=189691 RepID=UPI0013D1B964|nr:LacI family DNA-binding transcriptional regulator [Paenibacillus elgii]